MFLHKGVILEVQYVPIPRGLMDLAYRRSKTKYDLVFFADELPPLGYRSYYIKKTKERPLKPVPDSPNTSSMTSIGNEVSFAKKKCFSFLTKRYIYSIFV